MNPIKMAAAAVALLALPCTASIAGAGKVLGWEVDGKYYRTQVEACQAAARYNSSTGKGVFTGNIERYGEDTITCEIRDVDGSIGAPQVMRQWGPADESVGEQAPAEKLLPPRALPPARQRGITDVDDVIFQGLAVNLKLIFIVRESNKAAVRFTGKPGFMPKPQDLKAKTLQGDPAKNPHVGLASADPADRRLQEMLAAEGKSWRDYVIELGKSYFVVGPPPAYLVLDQKTRSKFYSDIDLHGVYDLQGRPQWHDSLKELFNARLKDRLIQHGPHDCWPKRNSAQAGPNAGPQPPVTVYMPTGEMQYVKTRREMEKFYARQKLPWPYAKGAREDWCNLGS